MMFERPTILYKYLSGSSAEAVLRDFEFRWNAPGSFNDPFDTQFPLEVGEDFDAIDDEIMKLARATIYGDVPPAGNEFHDVHKLWMSIRKERDRFPRNVIEESISKAIPNLKTSIRRVTADAASEKWEDYCSRHKILCLSEHHDRILMWSHYADGHKGIVIGLQSSHPSSLVSTAKRVQYQDSFPKIATPQLWAEWMTGKRDIDLKPFLESVTITKSPFWEYEGEWRCILESTASKNSYIKIPFDRLEIACIYLGCRIDDTLKNRVLGLVRSALPHCSVSQATRSATSFALDFVSV